MGSNIEKKQWTYKSIQKSKQEVQDDNFCYRRVRRAITKLGAIENFDGDQKLFRTLEAPIIFSSIIISGSLIKVL